MRAKEVAALKALHAMEEGSTPIDSFLAAKGAEPGDE